MLISNEVGLSPTNCFLHYLLPYLSVGPYKLKVKDKIKVGKTFEFPLEIYDDITVISPCKGLVYSVNFCTDTADSRDPLSLFGMKLTTE